MLSNVLQGTRQFPRAKNYLTHNVHCSKVEKLCSRGYLILSFAFVIFWLIIAITIPSKLSLFLLSPSNNQILTNQRWTWAVCPSPEKLLSNKAQLLYRFIWSLTCLCSNPSFLISSLCDSDKSLNISVLQLSYLSIRVSKFAFLTNLAHNSAGWWFRLNSAGRFSCLGWFSWFQIRLIHVCSQLLAGTSKFSFTSFHSPAG